eukprot:scaffold2167_cov51-Attheya_sp.AAC.2
MCPCPPVPRAPRPTIIEAEQPPPKGANVDFPQSVVEKSHAPSAMYLTGRVGRRGNAIQEDDSVISTRPVPHERDQLCFYDVEVIAAATGDGTVRIDRTAVQHRAASGGME